MKVDALTMQNSCYRVSQIEFLNFFFCTSLGHIPPCKEVRVVSWHISVQDVYAVLYSSIIMLGNKE